MARRVDTSAYKSFGDITQRLDQIVGEVRRKDLSLESSLDLFDEAIALGSKAVDFVDTEEPSAEELRKAERATSEGAEASAEPVAEKPAAEETPAPEAQNDEPTA